MALSIDTITLGVPEVEAAHDFYTAAFSPTNTGGELNDDLDLHGMGRLSPRRNEVLATEAGANEEPSGFRGYVLSCVVEQPSEVESLLDTATTNGAQEVKPAKKQLFGEFTAVYRAPDGAVWKLAAVGKKNTGPVGTPVQPTETAIYLGVARPKSSKVFYEALGMRVNHDYGDKFVDFTITGGMFRLGLLPRKGLAKDVGVPEDGHGFPAAVLTHEAATPEEVDRLLETADSAGGRVTAAAARAGQSDYTGRFTDPDGHHWAVTART
ncbi:putative lactoylglutathione lyase [Nocardiopsis sp. Huas11]|uniref:VOC family protein n=1 Tax=Nocardiopsis sp. Huas11 TaxID=2183912 RepID=UPI000EB11F1F|nr:VOC family protein [Nocardiopsis sp. Huas11]RKS08436.1 putative lactoylglutathione lyase [Nocardiopsis sp. Huas11]